MSVAVEKRGSASNSGEDAKIVLKDLRQSFFIRNPGQKSVEEFVALEKDRKSVV